MDITYWLIMKARRLPGSSYVYGPFCLKKAKQEFTRYHDMYGASQEYKIRITKEISPYSEPT